MKTPSSEVAATLLAGNPSELAYQEVLPELLAMADDDVEPINSDVMLLVTNMLGALPEIRDMRPQIEATFKQFDLEQFDRFETYVLALNHANALYRSSHAIKREATQQATIAEERRTQLFDVATTLSRFGLIDGRALKDIRKTPGYAPLASDVLALVALLKQSWDDIEDKCPLTEEDLNAAALEALDLQIAIGLKEQAPELRDDRAVNRRKAYTLFRRCFEPLRRAALYLYGEDEASKIVPKLTQGNTRSRGSRNGSPTQDFDAPDLTPSQDGASRANGTASGNGATPSTSNGFAVTNPQNLPITPVFEPDAE